MMVTIEGAATANLATLHARTADLTREQEDAACHYLLGAAAGFIHPGQWARLVDMAVAAATRPRPV